jgi:putative transposase
MTTLSPVAEDQRPQTERLAQPHQLTHAEETAILDTCNERRYRSLPPSQIVPRLADKGLYLASESSFYRVLKKHQQHVLEVFVMGIGSKGCDKKSNESGGAGD